MSGFGQAGVVQPTDQRDGWTSTIVLGDGSTATLRPITPEDAPRLQEFHDRQSSDSNYYRYFSPKPHMSDTEAARFTNLDFVDRVALVVEDHGELIGWASYERWKGRPDAEVAFQVDDQHKGKGIATLLLEHLAVIARSNGIERFTAEALAENRAMLAVFAKAGWPLQRRFESGVVDIDFPLEDSADFLDSVETREQRADSRAVARLLMPRSIAVIGASDTPGSTGRALWQNTSADPAIECYPVNPRHDTVDGHRSYAAVTEIEHEVDLAIIAVSPAELENVIDGCIAKRVRGAVLVTAPDDADDASIATLIRHARRNGLRIIGPASMGIASPLPTSPLNATLVDVTLEPGPVAISTQSGTLGASVLRLARDLDVGLSWFVSLGDKGDVSSNDLLQFWDDDEATRVICLYTESVGNPRKFVRIAHRVSRRRPIIVVRTGSAIFGTATDAMYRRSGVIEVPSVQTMLDTARVMAHQPLMRGDRVAIVSNARSPRVAAAATLAAAGLKSVEPPRQLDWRASPDDYADALARVRDCDDIDGVIVIHAPPTEDEVAGPAAAIDGAMVGAEIPVTAVMLGLGDGRLSPESNIASFSFPEQAAANLARLRNYSAWRETQADDPAFVPDELDRGTASALIADELHRLENPSDPDHPAAGLARPETIQQVLGAYGISMPDTRLVLADDAVVAARDVGYPVALKAIGRIHGTSLRAGVGLDLGDDEAVRSAVAEMRASLGEGADQLWVQSMVPPGRELRATVDLDDRYGPVISAGLGGFDADVIGDVSSRIAPISASAARQLVAETRAAIALTDTEIETAAELLVHLTQLVSDHPEIRRFDLNPIIVSDDRASVVDATLELAEPSRATVATRRLESD